MRFAISIPQDVTDGAFNPDRLRAYLQRAEDLGFDSAWVAEQVLSSAPLLGPIEMLTYAAAFTTRLRLGCAMFISPMYSPLHLAKSISSLDQLSRGRLEVGVATGGRKRMFSAFAVDPATLVARFVEGLELMKAVWTESRVPFKGQFWQLDNAMMEPKPFQKPFPPIWFGGSHPDAVRRAVKYANGFFGAGSQTTAQFAEQVRVLRSALEESVTVKNAFQVAKRVYIAVDDDASGVRKRIVDTLEHRYGYFGLPNLESVAVSGPPMPAQRDSTSRWGRR
jgi:alkanesulfonate monooxygenase SsuD/methylene tetrahydromethanopterin reductase-like flavin-dependent oxidoreductase (luciferase family)